MTRTVRIILCALCVGMLSGCSIVGTWESEGVEPAEDAKAFNIATATFNDDMTFSCRATCGGSGEMLFHTFWARLLDAGPAQLDALAFEASRRELLDYRRAGAVVDITFPGLLTDADMEAIRGED